MPRRFSAPIPIYIAFNCRRDVYQDDVRYFVIGMADRVPVGEWRDGLLRLAGQVKYPSDAYFLMRLCLIAWEVTVQARDIVRFTQRVVGVSQNAFEVDDQFMLYINPDLAKEAWHVNTLVAEIRSIPDGVGRAKGQKWLYEELCAWMEERIGRLYPDADLATIAEFVLRGSPICWHHSRGHENLVLRGRKSKPIRRAATWGTYVLAWLLGSETLAVNLWNSLSPAEYQWGSPNSPPYALAKYSGAKNRLVKELRVIGGQKLIPERVGWKPYSPLGNDIVPIIEAFSQTLRDVPG